MRSQSHRLESSRQRCKVCGNADKLNFDLPDEIWAAAVPEEYRDRVVCLSCFDDFARERQVAYAGYLTTLYFAGDRASLVLHVAVAVDVND